MRRPCRLGRSRWRAQAMAPVWRAESSEDLCQPARLADPRAARSIAAVGRHAVQGSVWHRQHAEVDLARRRVQVVEHRFLPRRARGRWGDFEDYAAGNLGVAAVFGAAKKGAIGKTMPVGYSPDVPPLIAKLEYVCANAIENLSDNKTVNNVTRVRLRLSVAIATPIIGSARPGKQGEFKDRVPVRVGKIPLACGKPRRACSATTAGFERI